jgi:hypothetical protein
MTGQSRFSRGQKLILGGMALALIAVLVVLGSFFRRSVLTSPLPTAVLPVSSTTATPLTRATPSPVASAQIASPASDSAVAAEVMAARRIEELNRNVGQIRELPKQQEVPLNFLDIEDMTVYLRRVLADAEQGLFVQRQQVLLAALDLLPKPDEAFPPTVQTRARQVLAFYDPDQAQIFIGPAGRDSGSPDISLVHQYAHAIIDQHFDLSFQEAELADADVLRARDALIEGDATAVLAMHSFGGVERADLDALAQHLSQVEPTDYEGYLTSRAMSDVVLFPYREGARFVGALLQAGWWPAVNAAYLDPPVSTEQILHPEKYTGAPRDAPRTVRVPDLGEDLGEDWRLVVQDVLGELILGAHLDQYLPDTPEARAAAAGWDGDRAVVWQDLEGREVLVIRSLWDSDAEATEFVQSYAAVIDRRLRGASRVLRSIVPPGGRWWRGETGDAYIQRERDAVLIIWTPDTDTMERVLAVFVFDEG